MHLLLEAHHLRIRDEVREFATERILPIATDFDARSEFPWDSVAEMAERGWMGVPVPESLGGMGRDTLSYLLVIEELARVDASHSITISAHTTLGTSPILAFGSDAQRERFVTPLASGKVIGGFGLTEPGAGSDAGGTRTRAVRVDGGYRISGSKIFITHAGIGEIFVVTAVTDPEAGARGITSFIVCKPTIDPESAARVGFGHLGSLPFTDGVSAGEKESKMGWRASDTRELFLEDAFVPDEQRLGEEGRGFINFMETLDAGRIGIAALSLGLAEGALDVVLGWGSGKERGAVPLFETQTLRFALADLATEIEAGRHLTYYAARLKDAGLPFSKEAAMAKLYCSELAMKATDEAVQLLGADGYGNLTRAERMFRDAKICEIGEGTSEIQRLVIARRLLAEWNDRTEATSVPSTAKSPRDVEAVGSAGAA